MEGIPSEEAKIKTFLDLQLKRQLGEQALWLAKKRQVDNEDGLSRFITRELHFEGWEAEISNDDGSRLTLLEYVKTDAHDWSPSYWKINDELGGPKTITLSIKLIGADSELQYIAGMDSGGKLTAVLFTSDTVISRQEA